MITLILVLAVGQLLRWLHGPHCTDETQIDRNSCLQLALQALCMPFVFYNAQSIRTLIFWLLRYIN